MRTRPRRGPPSRKPAHAGRLTRLTAYGEAKSGLSFALDGPVLKGKKLTPLAFVAEGFCVSQAATAATSVVREPEPDPALEPDDRVAPQVRGSPRFSCCSSTL